MPAGIGLFFPMANAECSNLEGFGTTDAELRACAMGFGNLISTDPQKLYATLDGEEITGLKNFRVESPLFHFGPLPDNNFVQFFCAQGEMCSPPSPPAGSTGISVSDGIYLMLHPLSQGRHLLHFHAEFDSTSSFVQDVTYHLIVTHESRE